MTNNHVKDISRIYLEQIVESAHLETDMKKRRKDNEKAVEDIKKTKAHKEMAAAAAKKFDEEVEQIDEISADLALAASKEAGKRAGILSGLSAGDPKVKAKAVKKRKQSERLYAKQAKKRVVKINPIEEETVEEEKKAKVKRWWDDDGDGKGYEEGEVSGKFARKKVKEALDPVGKEDDDIDNDGDVDKSDSYLKNRRKVRSKVITKEGFSNWRQDLIEIMNDEEGEKPIKEKKTIKNKIKTSATDGGLKIGEAVEQLGGQLIEMIELNGILDEITDEELFFISNRMIEESVREVFYNYLQEGYEIEEIEDLICESIDTSLTILTEAEVTYGHDTSNPNNQKRTGILQKIKGAVKTVGKGLARGAGYVAGAAVRGAKAIGRESAAGYQRGRQGSSASGTTSTSTSTSSTSSSQEDEGGSDEGEKKPGIISRIGSKLRRGLAKAARAVSRGARNVARRVEGGEKKEAPKAAPKKAEKPEDPWAGSATTPPKAKAKTKKAAAPKAKAPAAAKPKAKRKSKLDDLLASVRSEETQLDEFLGTGRVVAGVSRPWYDPKSRFTQAGTVQKVFGVTVPGSFRQGVSQSDVNRHNQKAAPNAQIKPDNRTGGQATVGITKDTKPTPKPTPQTPQRTPSQITRTMLSDFQRRDEKLKGLRNSCEFDGNQLQEKPGDGYLGPTPIPNPIRLAQDVVDAKNRSDKKKVDYVNKTLGPGRASMPKHTYFNSGPSAASRQYLNLQSYELDGNQIDEKTLTAAEKKKKEEIFKSLKKKREDFESRYPGRGEEVMHGVATKMAKKLA